MFTLQNNSCARYPSGINGVCGEFINTCSAGVFQDIVDEGRWGKWRCLGQNGGNNADCQDLIPIGGGQGSSCPTGCFLHNGECYKSCFIAGTKVKLADGSDRDIEKVLIGDRLLGQDGAVNTVLGFHRPLLGDKELWSINGGVHFVTAEHPFMTTEGWKSLNPTLTMADIDLKVSLLEKGDILITDKGNEKVFSLESKNFDRNTQLYNFILDGNNTYYADGYLVHNKNAPHYSLTGGQYCIGSEYLVNGTCVEKCGSSAVEKKERLCDNGGSGRRSEYNLCGCDGSNDFVSGKIYKPGVTACSVYKPDDSTCLTSSLPAAFMQCK